MHVTDYNTKQTGYCNNLQMRLQNLTLLLHFSYNVTIIEHCRKRML